MMISAREALERLREGNHRFVSDDRASQALASGARRNERAAGQAPFAIILGCSDSRVPAELVFDQGLGELFVIRVAGNIVAASQVGSVEFAAARFGTRLVVVLGHSQCGAILATLEELQQPTAQSRNLCSIVDRVRPSVEALLATELRHDPEALVRQAVRANIRRLGRPPAAWLRGARAARPDERAARRGRRVLARNRARRVLRRCDAPMMTRLGRPAFASTDEYFEAPHAAVYRR